MSAQEPNRLTPEETRDGWKLLFDGKTPKGWRSLTALAFPAESWTVEDGALRTIGEPPVNPWVDLVTVDSFSDFELRLEWKLGENANTGIKYLVQDAFFGELMGARRGPKALGYELQLVDDKQDPDAAGSAKQRSGALYYLLAPDPEPNPEVGKWNSARLIVRDGRVEHWINERKVLEFGLASAELRALLDAAIASSPRPMTLAGLRAMREPSKRATPIALQHHIGTVWFRNIKVRTFDSGSK